MDTFKGFFPFYSRYHYHLTENFTWLKNHFRAQLRSILEYFVSLVISLGKLAREKIRQSFYHHIESESFSEVGFLNFYLNVISRIFFGRKFLVLIILWNYTWKKIPMQAMKNDSTLMYTQRRIRNPICSAQCISVKIPSEFWMERVINQGKNFQNATLH